MDLGSKYNQTISNADIDATRNLDQLVLQNTEDELAIFVIS